MTLDAPASAPQAATGGEDAVALFGGEAVHRTAARGGRYGRRGVAETLDDLPGRRAVRLAGAGVAGRITR